MQVREREGVDAADGIDTLLVYLLAELDDEARLASFADGSQQVTPHVVAGLLQRKGQSDTLAQLYAGAGQAAAGLALWKVSLCSDHTGKSVHPEKPSWTYAGRPIRRIL